MATITIPVQYLEDARHAAIAEVLDDSEACQTDLKFETDRDNAMRLLLRDTRVLEQLRAATADVTIETEDDIISNPALHLLEEVVRGLSDRLATASQIGPLPMGDVLDIAERLRWAADEAIRVCPDVGYRQGEPGVS